MLEREFSFIKANIQHLEDENLKISKAKVGWHLDHSLKVINSVVANIKDSKSKEYQHKFNGLRLVVFTLGFFPRGKAKSPKRVLPPEIISKNDIEYQLKIAEKNVEIIDKLDKNQFFTHPLFEQLNKKQTIKFLRLHTNHHLKIVKDILK
ncbi:hypothetical protein SAMN05216503_2633 [Polaribacter sp. KT25b]|uniref:DUF1569 domain-containing protein n=1 Tax=Polaribacter sp. KT25b TaxID=1855336 RepID=UPI00087CFEAB|nr:DUF1569 domain-containing protein [Polaribacter sp. KT25b]SDS30585.1 hypothetical protein SAMN05216503_2633 [Polaribacter sp. KT25b]